MSTIPEEQEQEQEREEGGNLAKTQERCSLKVQYSETCLERPPCLSGQSGPCRQVVSQDRFGFFLGGGHHDTFSKGFER